MKTVEAIKDVEKLDRMKQYLKESSLRDYCLFLLGINTGIRIHDLLHLKVGQLIEEPGGEVLQVLKSDVYHFPPVYLNDQLRGALSFYLHNRKLETTDYLFKSRKTANPITRQQAYRIINEASKQARIPESIGLHTLRKTFAYHAYKKGIAISLIQNRLQHQTSSETKKYIGLSNEPEVDIRLDVNL